MRANCVRLRLKAAVAMDEESKNEAPEKTLGLAQRRKDAMIRYVFFI